MPSTYVFLMMPLLALAGLAGVLAGGPFVGVLTGGRVAVELAVVVLGAMAVAGYFGSRRLVVKSLDIAHKEIAPEFDGVRIAQLSDLHVGPHTSTEFLARIARQVEEARPDLIVYTGDMVDDHARDADDFLRAFGHLRAPLGVYAIAGNHDVFAGWSGVAKRLHAAGVQVLVNEGTTLRRNGAELWIGGTGDPAAIRLGTLVKDSESPVPDLDRTMAHAPRNAYRIVLAHNPALWRGLAARGAHLTLSGHTHHGQFSIPALNWSLASPFLEHAMGRYDAGAATLYINPGTNFWGIPLRLGAWPEITLVTLRHSQ
jgi:predicted MPP superfamily phosphohydrolase